MTPTKLHTLQACNNKGFSFLEIAISLVIIGLLTTGGIISLSAQIQSSKRAEAKILMLEIKQSLMAFVRANNGRLPFADIGVDGIQDSLERGDTSIGQGPGFIPFATLGLPPVDPWGRRIRYALHEKASVADCADFRTTLNLTNGIADVSAFPRILETDASPTPASWTVAFTIISAGAKDADGNGSPFDRFLDIDGVTVIADNSDGSPSFAKAANSDTYDDITLYAGEYLFYTKACL